MSTGDTLQNHREAPPSYLPDGDPGRFGGGTYTSNSAEPTLEAYENIFGPSARDIKQDLQRFKRHGRWHLPDILKGPNQYLTDRVDGLITDATNSPFTSRILPYKYITNVDGKIKWNVWSFDEGLASRVPYESAARTLTQSKRSFAGYFIRQGMAIVLEHNFMMTEAGRENFRRQLNQLVGSIQLTNDLDVHVALVLAPSYQKTMNEKYLTQDKSAAQICREFVELFGFVQKNQNALDILIEEAKGQLKTWGAPMPDFMLCNSKLTFQLTMIPDVTNYVTKGPEGAKKLKTGPDLSSYRGIGIVHTRAFSMETGAPPRDMLRRRVRVAEFYRIVPHKDNHKRLFQIYNEERDTWSSFTFQDLLQKALCDRGSAAMEGGPGKNNNEMVQRAVHALSAPAAAITHSAAPMGEAMLQAEGTLTGFLTEVYKQLMVENAKLDFTWEARPISDKLVFVPGAMDLKSVKKFVSKSLDMMRRDLPEYIKAGVQDVLEKYGGGPLSHDIENRVKVVIQAIAPYHRNMLANDFVESCDNLIVKIDSKPEGWDDVVTVKRAFEDLNANSTKENVSRCTMYRTLNIRNYLRFGIPRELLGSGTWGKPCTMKQGLKLGINDLSRINYLDVRLRDSGAWFCPNHFKEHELRFTNLGDHVGYHMLLNEEFITAMMRRKMPWDQNQYKNNYHLDTLLIDIITNPKKYEELYKVTEEKLKELNEKHAGQEKSRTALLFDLGLPILTAIETKELCPGYRVIEPSNFMVENFFWMFPRTESCQDDVFCNQARRQKKWMKQLWDIPEFQKSYALNFAVTRKIAEDQNFDTTSNDSINYVLRLPAKMRDVEGSARNFFCMIAWRMFADQEKPLGAVYDITTGAWDSNIDSFLFPPLDYSYSNFGQGVMNYSDPSSLAPQGTNLQELQASNNTKDIEVVIVRPNIEHYMMGIILGQGGESLGSTFWGQTELSCYDDSMHGIWGMSYKYHERAIVINERNLIRLWDVAYDGYVGGKDDTAVAWDDNDETRPYSRTSFMQATTDVTRPYRGPSMMVMAFHHGESKNTFSGVMHDRGSNYKHHFNSNWPSPIVFYDRLDQGGPMSARADFDNLHAVEVEQFRVFNSPLYRNAYRPYKDKMPNFWELHTIRKNAGLAATENEVSSDALAFQGTMRVLSADSGAVIQEVLGSGHHGPDFIGVASLRAGKGYRLNSQPTVHRLV